MKLIFERSKKGKGCSILPPLDVPDADLPEKLERKTPLNLPNLDENEISRHYNVMAKRSFGVNDGFYPLGSCTMKYNPKVNEEIASLPGFSQVHPLQGSHTLQGCLELLDMTGEYLNEITGMDAFSFQPAAGAHGELAGLLLFKAYHESRNDSGRNKIIIPDSAHGTNPATAAMVDYEVINIPSNEKGYMDIDSLKAALGNDIAGLMLTNPNTLGIFDPNILEITRLVHETGGLNYYDGANLNAIMGIVRPGDMGFDAIHLNLHKSFSTPHGGGGPGSGAVGCKSFLIPFMPLGAEGLFQNPDAEKFLTLSGGEDIKPQSIGRLRTFYGNFLVVVKAAAYIAFLGKENIPNVAKDAVLNANYLMNRLKEKYSIPCGNPDSEIRCLHEFVISLKELKDSRGITAMDMSKALQDQGMHPPTMYFPLIIPEALMVEPTETESKETLDAAADVFIALYEKAEREPELFAKAPLNTVIGRPDDVKAARTPILRYKFN